MTILLIWSFLFFHRNAKGLFWTSLVRARVIRNNRRHTRHPAQQFALTTKRRIRLYVLHRNLIDFKVDSKRTSRSACRLNPQKEWKPRRMHSGFTNWGDYKSKWIRTNQIKCWFLVRGENRSTRAKTSQKRVENQQTQATYDGGSRNRTQTTLVQGECSHHRTNPALLQTRSDWSI